MLKRTILYRGQHRRLGEQIRMGDGKPLPSVWCYGGILQGEGDFSIIYGKAVQNPEDFTQLHSVSAEFDKWVVYSKTVGQYTGLNDVHGKPIFEDDIVRVKTLIYNFNTAVVKWSTTGARWVFETETGNTYPLDIQFKIEVLGNVFDNPLQVAEPTKELITRFAEKQKHVWCCCPRCGMDRMNKDVSRNALSRRVDIMICDVCGNLEGLEDIPGNPKLPLEKWELIEHPERFFLKGKDYNQFYFVFTDDEAYPFQNAYMIVEGFDETDAVQKVVGKYGKTDSGTLPYACYFSREEWNQGPEMRERYKYVGTLRLNNTFEESE